MSDNNGGGGLLLAGLSLIGGGILALMGKKRAEEDDMSFVEGVISVVNDGVDKMTGEAVNTQRRNIRQLSNEELKEAYDINKYDEDKEWIINLIKEEFGRRHISY